MPEERDIYQVLCEIRDTLESDKYESLGVWTIGGPPGMYQLRSPVNTECEYMVIGAALAATAGNGLVVVSNNNPSINNMVLATPLGASSSGSDMGNPFEGVVLPVGTSVTPALAIDYWMPLGRGANIYVSVVTTASYAYLALRRSLEREIPMMPRVYPHSHSQPPSRRRERVLPAEGPFGAGFEEQYPVPGGKPYQHIAESFVDPGWSRFGRGANRSRK